MIQMTRKEYEAQYGHSPVISSVSKMNTDVAPRRMSKAEYDEEFGAKKEEFSGLLGPARESLSGLGTLYGGGEQGIANKLKTDVQQGASDIEKGQQQFNDPNYTGRKGLIGTPETGKAIVKTGFRMAGDVAGTIYAPFGAAIGATGLNKVFEGAQHNMEQGRGLAGNIIDRLTDIPAVQTFVEKRPNLEEDFGRFTNIVLGALDSGKIDPKTAIPRTKVQIKNAIGNKPLQGVKDSIGNTVYRNERGEVVKTTDPQGKITFIDNNLGGQPIEGSGALGLPRKIQTKAQEFNDKRIATKNAKSVTKVSKDIYDIENNYKSLRNANEYAKDEGAASRTRIANTDVLTDAADTDGIVRTKQPGGAVDLYRKQTIDGAEGVVRDNLVRENATVNLAEIERDLTVQVYRSGLEGSDLDTAINGIKKEIAGLKRRADEFGNVPLYKIHDAKISTTRNIDFHTPPETKTYRKAVARTYKKIVEQKSKVEVKVGDKAYKIEDINKKLGERYGDIERLEALDGKRVKGGKLGKYTAQISGNIVGAGVGAVTGPLGMLFAPVIGGEVGSYLKGRSMASTFGKNTGKTVPKDEILEKAKELAKSPAEIKLSTPDVNVGVPKDMPQTKETMKLEKDISRNVEAQKKAIAEKNFGLVTTLKKIYQHLVEKLKTMIQAFRDMPNKEGGFISNRLYSAKGAKDTAEAQSQQLKSPSGNNNILPDKSKGLPNKEGGFILMGEGEVAPKTFAGLQELSTNLIEAFKGMPDNITEQQFKEVLNRTKKMGVKKADEELVTSLAKEQMGYKTYEELRNSGIDLPKWKENSVFELKTKSIEDVYPSNFDTNYENIIDMSSSIKRGDRIAPIAVDKAGTIIDGNHRYNAYKKLGIKNIEVFEETSNSRKINLTRLAKDVQTQLVPLTPTSVKNPRWSNVGSDYIGDGKYGEVVYQSPIKTSAGDVHYGGNVRQTDRFGNTESIPNPYSGYFSHVRFNDLADGKTRKILETQSDLMQKENFAKESLGYKNVDEFNKDYPDQNFSKGDRQQVANTQKLQPYNSNDPLAQLRTFREEVKRAAQDGKDTILIPSGDTAMKIEGLGDRNNWSYAENGRYVGELTKDNLKTGMDISLESPGNVDDARWIITDVLGDGKFKAVPKDQIDRLGGIDKAIALEKMHSEGRALARELNSETFDISGKVDQQHFVYKLNESAIPKEARKMGLTVEKVPNLNTKDDFLMTTRPTVPGDWWKITGIENFKEKPVSAFGKVGINPLTGGALITAGAVAGAKLLNQDDE